MFSFDKNFYLSVMSPGNPTEIRRIYGGFSSDFRRIFGGEIKILNFFVKIIFALNLPYIRRKNDVFSTAYSVRFSPENPPEIGRKSGGYPANFSPVNPSKIYRKSFLNPPE
jgi:hypothetical protein